jgi:hypothetical protein
MRTKCSQWTRLGIAFFLLGGQQTIADCRVESAERKTPEGDGARRREAKDQFPLMN